MSNTEPATGTVCNWSMSLAKPKIAFPVLSANFCIPSAALSIPLSSPRRTKDSIKA